MGRRQVIDPCVRAEVIATYGNTCWLGLPGCTVVGEEDDHIVPHSHGGKATVANIRRACKHCNASRQDRVLYGYGARMHIIVCPPGCDATALDYITEHSRSTDPVVAYSYLADAMGVAETESRAERVARRVPQLHHMRGTVGRVVRAHVPVQPPAPADAGRVAGTGLRHTRDGCGLRRGMGPCGHRGRARAGAPMVLAASLAGAGGCKAGRPTGPSHGLGPSLRRRQRRGAA